ncbi:hypothetical protein LEMLEM_LOCUS1633 [Lemmus lemmus]
MPHRDFVGKWRTTHILEQGVPPACLQQHCILLSQPTNATHFHYCPQDAYSSCLHALCSFIAPMPSQPALSLLHPCLEVAFVHTSPNKYLM